MGNVFSCYFCFSQKKLFVFLEDCILFICKHYDIRKQYKLMTIKYKHDIWRLEVSILTEISSKTSLLIKKHHWLRPICSSRNAKKVVTSPGKLHKQGQHQQDRRASLRGKGWYEGWDSARERVRSSLTLRSLRLVLILI